MSRLKYRDAVSLALSAAAGAAAMAHPVNLAAQAAGVKAGDLPDLTIKEAKIYVTDREQLAERRGRSERRKRKSPPW